MTSTATKDVATTVSARAGHIDDTSDASRQGGPAKRVITAFVQRFKFGLLLILLLVALAVGRLVVGDSTFPSAFNIPLGDWIENFTDWFIKNAAWFYDPIASGLTGVLTQINTTLNYTPVIAMAATLIAIVYCAAGARLSILTAASLYWAVAVGVWTGTLETIGFMFIAVLVSCVIGIVIGVIASLNSWLDSIVRAVLDGMQAFPSFAYLVPVVFIFGTGDAGALIVTIIWATPPVARLTAVGLRGVREESVEAATSFGATPFQVLRDVKFPMALPSIGAGINQTVMFAISMATISAMIGGTGLGQSVWSGLSRLDFGEALESGIMLVLLAVILDRASGRLANPAPKKNAIPTYLENGTGNAASAKRFAYLHRRGLITTGAVILLSVVITLVPGLRDIDFSKPPSWMRISLRGPVEVFVNWTTINFGAVLDVIRDTIQVYALNPLTSTLEWIPWPTMIFTALLVGVLLLGIRGGLLIAAGATLLGAMGMWQATAETVALVGVSVGIALLIGFPLGVAMSRSDRLASALRPIIDTLQTLPIFLFVIPAVIFMGSGPVTGVLATSLYAISPIVRLTNLALRSADPEVVEAAKSFGATEGQMLRDVRVPLGMPTILVGINQTVLLALAMAVVAALVGTPGLGEELLIAVGSASFGSGVEAGIAMFILALTFDRVFSAATRRLSFGRHLNVR